MPNKFLKIYKPYPAKTMNLQLVESLKPSIGEIKQVYAFKIISKFVLTKVVLKIIGLKSLV